MYASACASANRLSSFRGFSSRSATGRSPRAVGIAAVTPCHAAQNHLWLARRGVLGAAICSFSLSRGVSPVMGASASNRSVFEQVLDEPNFPLEWPYQSENFQRYDESSDTIFYDSPRFVTHIDDGAIKALTEHYNRTFPAPGNKDVAILDICSSWISHYPKGYTAGRISGLGMNEEELARNEVLTDYVVKDLNDDPILPYEDNTFDIITNAVSVDYLNKPREIFKEMHRVLKPGGTAMMSFSNRCFPTKAISIWTATGDLDHVYIVGSYFHYTPGFAAPKCSDISPGPGLFGGKGDPMYVVYASKTTETPDM